MNSCLLQPVESPVMIPVSARFNKPNLTMLSTFFNIIQLKAITNVMKVPETTEQQLASW